MNKKIFLFAVISIISIIFVGCKKFETTGTVIENQNVYTSIDPILGQDYKLQVDTTVAGSLTIAIVSGTPPATTPVGDPETIDKIFKEEGSSNYSFQTGIMSGNFSILSADQIKISFVRNTPPYLSVRDVICAKNN
ncbi:hypothetical protein [uncultured Brachyspira sp.]|uniref:hypothetical protein n=1 Tax=uncultured Brachyspira sp. TaxID=221953 RepID=UPI00262E37B8|nr:hypothetical protein [uncultured Brachyspira sp.]